MCMSIEALALSATMALAAGLVGCFAVMRRMALAGDALSHVALPGIGVALALHINPLFGAVAMLLFAGLLVWAIEDRSHLALETIIGVVFSGALAIGSLMTSGEDLLDALFGGTSALSLAEIVFGVLTSVAVTIFVLFQRHALIVTLVSPDIARTIGIDVKRLNLVYLEMFALTVALGLRYLGVLLMGSLIIIPAATAKRVSRNLTQMLVVASTLAILVTVIGSLAASHFHRPTGPFIVTLAAAVFFLSALWGES